MESTSIILWRSVRYNAVRDDAREGDIATAFGVIAAILSAGVLEAVRSEVGVTNMDRSWRGDEF